ncbi:unnamed protein product [Vitrella brassicaformis CCMP3155]|uniref:Uncharacterized protein n=2 Tax=Vitrella brassicaformis TaxID=1169539 RepID=A0A0G4G6A4_VITBC|nr:unnamed protein product [Vitrella brassicaformis CCMP3155]|mmetsp:Transcript_28966/g.72197  ORF Transcript_28966/g.72197 Transcript_28966/m.72197 type:complete len:145 (+) Transcript_28966:140-574(+)|eukprot:CEM23788.1 unnamed protein product [Vitrella brassicaformis CCMP3155]
MACGLGGIVDREICRAYRQVCRTAVRVFGADLEPQLMLRADVKNLLRRNELGFTKEKLLSELNNACVYLKENVVQVKYEESRDTYQIQLREDLQGKVIDLRTKEDFLAEMERLDERERRRAAKKERADKEGGASPSGEGQTTGK